MKTIRVLLSRVAGLFTSGRAEREIKEEFASHLALQTAENISRGMLPEEARHAAHLRAGGLTAAAELVREQRTLPLIETLLADTRFGFRALRRNGVYTSVAILTLALGTGANSAVFSVVDGVVLRQLPYAESGSLVSIASTRSGQNYSVSVPDFMDWRAGASHFSGLVAGFMSPTVITGAGETRRLSTAHVSANALQVLAVTPLAGRSFRTGEDAENAPRVAILAEALWRRSFGADSTVIGKSVTLDGIPTVVIGIAPQTLEWPAAADIWIPTQFTRRETEDGSRGARWLDVIGRMKPGISISIANAEILGIAQHLEQLDPKHNNKFETKVTPLLASLVGDLERPLFILLGTTGFVLLIACANVASLTLGRIATRDAEFAVRATLGAGRFRIARQILTENILLSTAGGVVGLLVAFASIKALKAIAPSDIPRLNQVALDARAITVTMALTFITGIFFGLLPALKHSDISLHDRVRAAGRGALSERKNRETRRVLVIAEMSLAIVLLAGAGLLLRSFALLQNVNPGFSAEGVTTFGVSLPSVGGYAQPARLRQFEASLVSGITRLPGVEAVATSFALPLGGESMRLTFAVHGRSPTAPENEPYALTRTASENYFAVMKIPVLQGRVFNDRDDENGRQVLVISREVARRYFPNENPIGQYLETGWTIDKRKYGGEVIGIVGDVRQYALDSQPAPHAYMSSRQWPLDEYNIVVRSITTSANIVSGSRAVLQQLDNQIPMNNPRTLVNVVDGTLGRRKFYLTLLGAFAGIAMTLALIGIYGVMAYSVQQRRREIGIRLALGSSRRGIVRIVLYEGMRLVVAGVTIGIVGTFALGRLLEAMLFQVGARDPITLAAAPLLLTAAATLACLVPARKAALANPVEAIRGD